MKSWFDKDRTWFNRHLWWTWTFGNFVVIFVGLLPLFFSNSTVTPSWIIAWIIVWWVLGIIGLMLYVETIHLKQIGRNLWYLFLLSCYF